MALKFEPNYRRPFIAFVKKQHRPFKARINDEILKVCNDPSIGEFKTGDLSPVQVHKFRFDGREWLIGYHVNKQTLDDEQTIDIIFIDFYQIGTHENFYQDLKDYLRASGWYK